MAGDAIEAVELALSEGRYPDAVRGAEALLAQVTGEQRLRVEVAWMAGRVRSGHGDSVEVAELYQRARGTPWEVDAGVCLGQALFIVARRSEEAERVLHRTVELGRAQGDRRGVFRAMAYLGLIARYRDDLVSAERLLREAAAGLEEVGDLYDAAFRWAALADVLRWHSRWDEAHAAYERACRCARPFPRALGETLRGHAFLYAQRGDLARAQQMLEQALPLVKERGAITRARILGDLGEIARQQGRLDDARALIVQALAERFDRNGTLVLRLNLALVELERGDRQAARDLAEQVLRDPDMPWYRTFAHAIALACADDVVALDHHLDAVEASAVHAVYLERDLLHLYGRAAREWLERSPDRAARLLLLQHVQAAGLGDDTGPIEARMRDAREAGAAVPVGPLDLHAEVRAGGMGQVWRGVVRHTELPVAVKVLAAERIGDPRVADALQRELRAVARLDHPHIVPIVDHGQISPAVTPMTRGRLAARTPWLATRWAAHGTLADWCGRRTYSSVADALVQLLDALAAAHAGGLLHLDVKPANVLVASEEPLVTWLADFGIAQALGAGGDGQVAGTPAFMAPEQCRGATHHYGPWTDLYATGATAVALVQGHPPFAGTQHELLQQQVSRPLPPLQPVVPVPPGFAGWCARMLAKAPEQRFRCAADARAALTALGSASDAPLRPVAPFDTASSSTFVLEIVSEREVEAQVDDAPPAGLVAPMPEHPPERPARATLPVLAWAAQRLLPLREVPFVGRRAERDALWTALREVQQGARVVRLAGPPGSGRTRLLRWLADAATRSGAARVLWVAPSPGNPWRHALITLLRLDASDPELLRQRLPRQLDLHLGPGALGPTEVELLAQSLTGQGDRAPLDPLPLALRVVDALARERRVLVCVTTPDPDCAPFAARLLDALRDRPVLMVAPDEALPDRLSGAVVRLGPIADADIAALIDAMVPLEPDLRDALVRAADGAPATALWTVRGWLSAHRMVHGAAGLTLHEDTSLPTSPTEAVQRALDPVLAETPSRRRQIELAAVLGEVVCPEGWRRACEADGLTLDAAMVEALVSRGLLHEAPDLHRFADGAVRATVLERIPSDERAGLCRAAAASTDDDGTRGLHLLRAGDAAEALDALTSAIATLARRNPRSARRLVEAWHEARRLSGLPDDAPSVVRGEVACWRVRLPDDDALPDVARRGAQARSHGDRATEVQALLVQAHVGSDRLAAAEQLALVQRASTLVPDEGRAEALLVSGRIRLAHEDEDAALEDLQQSAALGHGGALVALMSLLCARGRVAEARIWADRARPDAGIWSYGEVVRALCVMAQLSDAAGRADLVDRRLSEAVALGAVVSGASERRALLARLCVVLRRGTEAEIAPIVARLAEPPRAPWSVAAVALLGGGDATERLEMTRQALSDGVDPLDLHDTRQLLELASARPAWAAHRAELRALAARLGGA